MSFPDDPPVELELLDPDVEQALSDALRAAFAPDELDARTQERLLAMALEDPLAPPSERELVESARLREALEGQGDHPDAALARALAAANRPEPPSQARLEPLARRALGTRRGNVVFVVFGAAAAAVALAASVMLVVQPAEQRAPVTASAVQKLEQSRSTAELFSSRFEPGGNTERIDRIALVRERELRENRFASWGVR